MCVCVFLVPAHVGSPGKRALKVCVCDDSISPGTHVPIAGDNTEVVMSFTYLGVDIHNTASGQYDSMAFQTATFGVPLSLFLQTYNSIESSSFLSSSMDQKLGPPLDKR